MSTNTPFSSPSIAMPSSPSNVTGNTVSLDENHYSVDPSHVGRHVELRFDPEDLTAIEVFAEGKPAGVATRS